MRITKRIEKGYELQQGIDYEEVVQLLGRYEDLGSIEYIEAQREALRQQNRIITEYIRLFGEIRIKEQKGRIIAWRKQN